MRRLLRLLALLAALTLIAGACGGSGDDPDDDGDITIGDDSSGEDDDGDDDGDGDGDGGGDGGGDDDGDGSEGDDDDASGDFMTIYGLPPGDSTEAEWAPYEYREDEFGSYEFVSFETVNSDLATAMAFYEDAVPAMGYVISDPIMLGTSYAYDISDPENPDMVGNIQMAELGGVLTITQQRNIVGPPDSTDGDGGDSASGSSDSAGEGDLGTGDAGDGSAVTINGQSVDIDWMALPSTPFFAPGNQASDPFFHIHTNPATDGFFFSLEMYLEWGDAWTGETGGFEISCSNPTTSTGICPYFDPDGPGPLPVLGGDFMTTGQIIINSLGPDGYDLLVGPVIFSDGTVINPFPMVG